MVNLKDVEYQGIFAYRLDGSFYKETTPYELGNELGISPRTIYERVDSPVAAGHKYQLRSVYKVQIEEYSKRSVYPVYGVNMDGSIAVVVNSRQEFVNWCKVNGKLESNINNILARTINVPYRMELGLHWTNRAFNSPRFIKFVQEMSVTNKNTSNRRQVIKGTNKNGIDEYFMNNKGELKLVRTYKTEEELAKETHLTLSKIKSLDGKLPIQWGKTTRVFAPRGWEINRIKGAILKNYKI